MRRHAAFRTSAPLLRDFRTATGVLRRDVRSVVALEFAIVAPVFLILVLIVLQVSVALFTQEVLDNAAQNAARLIRIGTITGSGYSSTLVSDICSNVVAVPSCSSNIKVYVATAASGSPAGSGFNAISTASVSGGSFSSSYAALTSNDDVILEIGYSWSWLGWIVKVTGVAGSGLLTSIVALQTEPY